MSNSFDIGTKAKIRWMPDYAVGVQEIDAEHQRLFSLASRLQEALIAGQGLEFQESLLEALVDYTSFHFVHEEELMERIGYPYYQDHCLQHEQLRTQVNAMKDRSTRGETLADEILTFLVTWLKCHTTTADRRIGVYMRKCGLVPS